MKFRPSVRWAFQTVHFLKPTPYSPRGHDLSSRPPRKLIATETWCAILYLLFSLMLFLQEEYYFPFALLENSTNPANPNLNALVCICPWFLYPLSLYTYYSLCYAFYILRWLTSIHWANIFPLVNYESQKTGNSPY